MAVISTEYKLTSKTAQTLAKALYSTIVSFCQEHSAEFEIWLKEQEKGEQVNGRPDNK